MDTNKAAFQLHQATERFFNAIVLTFTRYKPKTHDIEKLDRQASDLHADFFKVFPRATEQQKHCFDLLKNAYIDARYKRDYTITKEELEYLAFARAEAARVDQADLRGEDCEHGVTEEIMPKVARKPTYKPLVQLPPLSADEYEGLRLSIAASGVIVPIIVWPKGRTKYIIDGFHRKKIADELGYECPERLAVPISTRKRRGSWLAP